MDPIIKRLYQILVLGGIGALLMLMALTIPVVLNTLDFSMYNPGWNGCSDIGITTYKAGLLHPTIYFEQNELTLTQRSFADYPLDAPNATIIIIGPRATFSKNEGAYMNEFLKNGGMLLLADDFGTGNDLLKMLNTSTRFSGKLLLDLSFEKNASFVTVFDFLNRSHPLTVNVSHIVLNYPTALIAGKKNTTVLAASTNMSWLDTNKDGKEDTDEPSGPFPVLALERYGKGEIVLLSDPSVFINSMKDQLNNSLLRDNIFHYVYNDRTAVIIDESHRSVSVPLQISYFFPSMIGTEVKIAIVLLIIGAFIGGFTPIPRYVIEKIGAVIFRSKKEIKVEPSVEAIVDDVLVKHPSWSRKRLEDIIQRLR